MPKQKLVFTQEVDYALIVCRKQSDRIFEKKHEGSIDHSICQFIGIDLEERWILLRTKPTGSQKCKIHVVYGSTHIEIE